MQSRYQKAAHIRHFVVGGEHTKIRLLRRGHQGSSVRCRDIINTFAYLLPMLFSYAHNIRWNEQDSMGAVCTDLQQPVILCCVRSTDWIIEAVVDTYLARLSEIVQILSSLALDSHVNV